MRLGERLWIAGTSAIKALVDPKNGNHVAALADSTGYFALVGMRDKMLGDITGRQVLRERPLVTSRILNELRKLPNGLITNHYLISGTFGKAYVDFLERNGVSPDTRTPVQFIKDPELAYVMTRFRQCHDFIHTLLGKDISVTNEIAVKWFEMIQTGLPMTFLASFIGPLRLNPEEKRRLCGELPHVIRAASNSKFILNVKYEDHFDKSLTDFQKYMGLA